MQQDDSVLGEVEGQARWKLLHKAIVKDGQPRGEVSVGVCVIKQRAVQQHNSQELVGYRCSSATSAKELQPIMHIFVHLALRDYELLCRFKKMMDRLAKRPQPRFQKIYNVSEKGSKAKECSYLSLSCEMYRFSLGDICSLIKANKKIGKANPFAFPLCFVGYLRSFLLEAFRSVLDTILDEHNTALCLNYSFSLENILFSESYELLLGNLIHNHAAEADPLMAFIDEKGEKYIKKRIVDEIKQVLAVCYAECERSLSYSSDDIYKKLGKQDSERYVCAREELAKVEKLIRRYPPLSLSEKSQNYLFEVEDQLVRNQHPLASFHRQQQGRNLAQLRRLSSNQCYDNLRR